MAPHLQEHTTPSQQRCNLIAGEQATNMVQEIYDHTMVQKSPNWKRAQTTAAELPERFSQVFDVILPE
jgi:hypothetical protein